MAFLAPPPIQPIPKAGSGGDQIFAAIGCAFCHMPTLQSGPSPAAALNNVVFHPFSDFLLHDMGSLGDGIVQGNTGATEMRTAPLWGLRNVTAYLHDGRASTIPAAILAHDGQARAGPQQLCPAPAGGPGPSRRRTSTRSDGESAAKEEIVQFQRRGLIVVAFRSAKGPGSPRK